LRRLALFPYTTLFRSAEVVVGDADDGAAADCGVLLERRLDLGGVDVGAAPQDQVAAAVGEVHVTVGVHPAEVADALPAVELADRSEEHTSELQSRENL